MDVLPVKAGDVDYTPKAQTMQRLGLSSSQGVTLYQKVQPKQALFEFLHCPCQEENEYKVAHLPEGALASGRYKPSNQELSRATKLAHVQEESSEKARCWLTCCGCGNLRKLKLHINGNGGSQYVMKRKCLLGAWVCCNLTSRLYEVDNGTDGRKVGRVRENCDPYLSKCMEMYCLCTKYDDIEEFADGKFEARYQVRENLCCCNGAHNNFCGGTCFNNDMVFEVIDTQTDKKVAEITKTFGGGDDAQGFLAGFFRMICHFSSIVVTFPDETTEDQRALILAAAHHIDYKLFTRSSC